MKITNIAELSEAEFAKLERELAKLETLRQVLDWANSKQRKSFLPQIVSEVISQDEFTNDVIVPYKDLFLVFDTT